ncbi:MAG: RNA-binding transcriptional accessory protein [Ruminococcaceae bacterium]|nr:RNA-binding transcriptional accessory protein [Oscillospiraceae bacterium]
MDFIAKLSNEFSIKPEYAGNIISLLDEGNTIPFIARYRKEMHGSMDDQVIREVADRLEYLRNFEARAKEITELIEAQEKMTDEIRESIEKAETMADLENIYRPFRPKRKTRASVAKEKGLEPLAEYILLQEDEESYPIDLAEKYVDAEMGVETAEDALQGALDIIAEVCSDNPEIRKRLFNLVWLNGIVKSVASDAEADSVYTGYYDFSEAVKKISGHRVLAINRGEREEFLKVSVEISDEKPLSMIRKVMVKGTSPCSEAVMTACEDAYTRLLLPSIEREVRAQLTENADVAAMKLFATNLHQLLMQPPVKDRVVIGLDPGYRTGCKVAVVDGTGRVLDTTVIYPTHSEAQVAQSKVKLLSLIKKYGATVLSIGNGTASKETEIFAAEVIAEAKKSDLAYMIVNEAGASIYSASKLAAAELPELDLTLRSAVSIARRLQDPLAELVKIDPKSIGIGQYQHDMPQKRLGETLDGVVEDCVNSVGADLNTASPALLQRIAGLNSTVCKNIVQYREENGKFESRAELKKVPKLGPKAFEQCAGFLRVADSKEALDNTAVHPESYKAAKALLKLLGYTAKDVENGGIKGIKEKVTDAEAIAEELSIGVPTLMDILDELTQPGRDPRESLPAPQLRTDVMGIEDLREGMELTGTVRNVIDFGAFVDIGVHQDGLVHLSQISDKFIKHPSQVLKVGDIVKVKVLSVDVQKKRISLTMKGF